MDDDGVKGRILGKKPYLFQIYIYYFACLIGPPSLTIYILFDRFFHLFGVHYSQKMLTKYEDVDYDQIANDELQLIK